jgi:hypothetical protein
MLPTGKPAWRPDEREADVTNSIRFVINGSPFVWYDGKLGLLDWPSWPM